VPDPLSAHRRTLGSRGPVLGIADSDLTAQINPYLPGTGWVIIIATGDLSITETEFEVYHIALDGPVGSQVTVLINGAEWDYADGWANGWDPNQPLLLDSGDTIQLAWNVAATSPPYDRSSNIQPRATIWLRQPEQPQTLVL
jgi:hypothetical protein